jgi:hypothetical protein
MQCILINYVTLESCTKHDRDIEVENECPGGIPSVLIDKTKVCHTELNLINMFFFYLDSLVCENCTNCGAKLNSV